MIIDVYVSTYFGSNIDYHVHIFQPIASAFMETSRRNACIDSLHKNIVLIVIPSTDIRILILGEKQQNDHVWFCVLNIVHVLFHS